MNQVILTNTRLTRDPEIRYSSGEKSMCVARFTLAVDKNYKKSADDSANFINCICFGKTAETVEKYLKKGSKINVTGEWTTGSYKNQDGNTVYTNECTVSKLEFAESKAAQSQQTVPTQAPNDGFMSIPAGIENSLPFK